MFSLRFYSWCFCYISPENSHDKVLDKTMTIRNTKVSKDRVIAIRKDTRHRTVVAREFGISESSVRDIWNRRTWSWLE